jgi:alkaline phosphatase D
MGTVRSLSLSVSTCLLLIIQSCEPVGMVDLPPSSPFHSTTVISHGVAAGDVTADSAVIWFRTIGPAKVRVEWSEMADPSTTPSLPTESREVTTSSERDFTGRVVASSLRAATSYRYRIVPIGEESGGRADPGDADRTSGRFTTAPLWNQSVGLTILWTADLGGQQRCRREEEGYAIFDQMVKVQAAFAVLLGDLIYADGGCPSPPNAPGGDFIATSIDQYRAKHRYQRGAAALQRFLSAVPVYVTWDDHEVRNNFSGPHEPLTPIGRQALLEYWPVRVLSEDSGRLYRSVRWGRTAELFLLDTRQYRDRNADLDGPEKTMLGKLQREWLMEGLTRSTARWKIIGTTVPLSIPKGGTLTLPGNDSWARGADGTGFFTELATIIQTLQANKIRNVIWLAADVHYVQANRYDVDQDGETDFYEFVCGPLSAAYGLPVQPDPILHPTTLYNEAGYSNFGVLTVGERRMTVEIRDDRGNTRFAGSFDAR